MKGTLAALAQAERDARDLRAQEDMATWAFWMIPLTALSAVVSVLGLFFLLWSLRQTATAIADNRMLGEAQISAYVHADEITLGKDGDIIVICRNTGQTPTRYFEIGGELLCAKKKQTAAQVRFSDYPMKRYPPIAAGLDLSAKLEPARGAELPLLQVTGQMEDDENLLVLGAIIYEDVFGIRYISNFAFFRDNSSHGRFLRPHGNIPAFARLKPGK